MKDTKVFKQCHYCGAVTSGTTQCLVCKQQRPDIHLRICVALHKKDPLDDRCKLQEYLETLSIDELNYVAEHSKELLTGDQEKDIFSIHVAAVAVRIIKETN